ncbi:WD40 repeat domain-containing protein [Streptomyces sp. G-G2]|uniref:WD40 repeat domain-containing protein n=1 Tax=Streptomyces sp. G-G2 TaxID=3046201 RepID=UPI0024BB3602|nr:WD40 repeat domain-containing protein [Streptomyces sp. G-G2]MDJ0384591.1 WD40 repeat domain-containing protein [Streptomyces sp. G-G2]
MRPLLPAAATLVAVAGLALLPGAALAASGSPGPSSFTLSDPRIKESSGLAASKIHPGVYWTHNDSDDGPYVYGVDSATGRTVARVTMAGIGAPRDVEAISLGPDGQLYVGDIGDNLGGTWDHVWIYRFPEPAQLGDVTVKPVQYTVRYADGPRNAEALMVHPVTGRVYIASKSEDKGGLYEGPQQLSATGSNEFRRIAAVPWVTDGAFSPDGGTLALRGYFFARTFPWKDGTPQGEGSRVDAPWQGQAESVTYTPDGKVLMFGSEGANSRVVAVPVEPGGGAPAKPGTTPGGTPGSGPSASAGPGTAASGGGNFTVGAMVLVAATAIVLAGKRLVSRNRPTP